VRAERQASEEAEQARTLEAKGEGAAEGRDFGDGGGAIWGRLLRAVSGWAGDGAGFGGWLGGTRLGRDGQSAGVVTTKVDSVHPTPELLVTSSQAHESGLEAGYGARP
jgi:hypothetical protein